MVIIPLGLWVIVTAVILLLPRTYTSTAAFTPQGASSDLSALSGLAAQFGALGLVNSSNESPDFYAALLQSPDLLEQTVATPYDWSNGPSGSASKADLVTQWGYGNEDHLVGMSDAVEDLQDAMSVATGSETGIVTLIISVRSPGLAQQIASRMLELVSQFNLEARQSQAAAEHRFTEARLVAVGRELKVAEDSLRDFLSSNRTYTVSPTLTFEHDRLQRQVDLKQAIVTSLSQINEQAKIEAVRNTPVMTIVDPATYPAQPDHRHLILKGLLVLILGILVALVWAFASDAARDSHRGLDGNSELSALLDDARADLRRVWRTIRGILPRRGAQITRDSRS